jgi:FkbM family methyltransferase
MDTDYFILTHSKDGDSPDSKKQTQIISLISSLVFILPRNNLPYYVSNGIFESQLIDWSVQLCNKDKIFLDIGAHTGTYGINLASHSKKVYAFEPQRSSYYALCGSVALSGIDNIECINVGLGSIEQMGDAILNIRSLDGGGSSVCNIEEGDIIRREGVVIRTLDSYNIENIGFIKIDVESNEINVLKGARRTIKRSHYPKILFESNDGESETNPLFDYILNDLNYSRIIRINNGNMYLCENQSVGGNLGFPSHPIL